MKRTSLNSEQLSVIISYSLRCIRVVLSIEKRIFANSSASLNKLSKLFSLKKSVSLSKESQYFVSRHSLYDIDILEEKSAFEIAPLASDIFAPTLVPLLNNCFESINSFLSLLRNWYAFTILTANKYALSYRLLFKITSFSSLVIDFVSNKDLRDSPYKKDSVHCLLFTENCPQSCFI